VNAVSKRHEETAEELNAQRKAEHEAAGSDRSLVGAVESTVDRLLQPLINRPADAEDLEEQREENDEEQRPG
jgi:ABC-type nitrate/sulfonate/bicarbonate transport system substrate-binding protein